VSALAREGLDGLGRALDAVMGRGGE